MEHSTTAIGAEKHAAAPVHAPWSNLPMAAPGLQSYRYAGNSGWIMIGAKDDEDALRKAQASNTESPIKDRLQRWDGKAYVPAIQTA